MTPMRKVRVSRQTSQSPPKDAKNDDNYAICESDLLLILQLIKKTSRIRSCL
jgi:hypothetical protein